MLLRLHRKSSLHHVYHYDSKEHVFEMADKFEERQAERDADERDSDKGSLLDDLKVKKEEVAKEAPEKHAKWIHEVLPMHEDKCSLRCPAVSILF